MGAAPQKGEQQAVLLKILPAAVGSLLEWYEYGVFGYFAGNITENFFADGRGGNIATWASYAVTFAFRPIGGLVFGRIADRLGRKPAMQLTIMFMLLATVGQGCIPSFYCCGDGWGDFGMAMLLLCRAVQGLSAGGELSTAAVYISEVSPPETLGRSLSWISISGSFGGFAAAAAVSALLDSVLTLDQLRLWGWRLPFVLSVIPGTLLILFRRLLEETSEFEEQVLGLGEEATQPSAELEVGQAADPDGDSSASAAVVDGGKGPAAAGKKGRAAAPEPVWEMVSSYPLAAFIGCVGSAGIGAFWYVVPVYGVSFLENNAGLSTSAATWASMVAYLVTMSLCYFVGQLIDTWGAGKVYALALLVSCLLAPLPLFYWWTHAPASQSILAAYVGMVAVGIVQSLTSAIYLWLIELFPTRMRATGTAIAYNFGVGIFGGAGPLIAAAGDQVLDPQGLVSSPALYVAVVSLCSLIAVLASRALGHRGWLKLTHVRASPY